MEQNRKLQKKKKNQNINLRVPYNRYKLSSFIFGLLFGYSNVKTSCTYIKPIFIALSGFLFLFNAKRKHILVVHTKKSIHVPLHVAESKNWVEALDFVKFTFSSHHKAINCNF